ncbi:MAG: PadR family transcriptional regulator [Gammaproteobacteria bacterium]
MAKPNKTRYALLGFLSMQDATGYDIKKQMEHSTNYFWRETDSSIYPILKQLLEEGMVSCKIGNEDSGKPKKIYSITEDGYREFLDWLDESPVLEQQRNELLLKVFFGWNLDKKITIDHIKKFQQQSIIIDENYKSIEKKAPSVNSLNNEQLYQYLTLKAGMAFSEARLKWSKEAIKLLENRALATPNFKKKMKKKPYKK